MWVVLHRSVFGRYLFAVGKNEEAARYSGINTDRIVIAAYIICAILTAIAAIFFAMYTRRSRPPRTATSIELYAIAAAACPRRLLGTVLLRRALVNLLGISSEFAQFRGHGVGDPDRRHRRPAVLAPKDRVSLLD